MDDIIEKFRGSLAELMSERGLSIVQLARELCADPSMVRRWFSRVNDIKLKTLLRLADYFSCSLEFLCGKSSDRLSYVPTECPPFCDRLPAVMAECGVRAHMLFKNTNIIPSEYYYWRSGGQPLLTKLNVVAEYLGITLDRLVGRNK